MTQQRKSQKAHELMGRAKAALILEQPFFASLICSMPLIEDTNGDILQIPTMGTDGKTVWYNPEFTEKLSPDEVKFVLCHEVMHSVYAHMYRRGSRDPRRWNMAGDYVINDMLAAEKIGRMPEGGLMNSQLVVAGNGTTEGVYDLLPENAGGDGVGGDKQWDTCMDAGGSEADRSAGEAEMKVKVAQAAQAAKMCGNLSQRLEQFVGDVLKPKIDWRDVLRRFIDQRAKVEYTFARPKRRWVSEDLFLPSLGGSSLGEVLIAVDQSGSVGPDEVAEFKAEILAIHGDCRPSKLHVYYFDSKVAHKETYDPDDTPDIRRYTTGGTAFSPIFREADLDDLELSCCVVLTDLCCADFGPAPTYPVLWITTSATHAPWGQVVEMNQRRP